MSDQEHFCQKAECDLPAVVRYCVLERDRSEVWRRQACKLHAPEARYKGNTLIRRPDLLSRRLSLAAYDLSSWDEPCIEVLTVEGFARSGPD
jgi:hypothetical protein